MADDSADNVDNISDASDDEGSEELSDEEEEFVVEAFLGKRVVLNDSGQPVTEYLIKWLGKLRVSATLESLFLCN